MPQFKLSYLKVIMANKKIKIQYVKKLLICKNLKLSSNIITCQPPLLSAAAECCRMLVKNNMTAWLTCGCLKLFTAVNKAVPAEPRTMY